MRLCKGMATLPNHGPVRKVKQQFVNTGLVAEATYVNKVACAGLHLGRRREETWPDLVVDCCCPGVGRRIRKYMFLGVHTFGAA